MAKYRVGERLIVNGIPSPSPDVKYNGLEVVVTKYQGFDIFYPRAYQVVFVNTGFIAPCAEEFLQRQLPKRGDLDTVVSWDAVGWKPNMEEK